MEPTWDIELEACAMTALFIQYEEPVQAANDEEYPEYDNLYLTPA